MNNFGEGVNLHILGHEVAVKICNQLLQREVLVCCSWVCPENDTIW